MGKESKNNFLGLLAFLAIVITAACLVIETTNKLASLNIPTGILPTIELVFLLVVVFATAWSYARTLHTFWKVLFWVILILTIAGFVLPRVL